MATITTKGSPVEPYAMGDDVFEMRPAPNDQGKIWTVVGLDEVYVHAQWQKEYRRFQYGQVTLYRRKGETEKLAQHQPAAKSGGVSSYEKLLLGKRTGEDGKSEYTVSIRQLRKLLGVNPDLSDDSVELLLDTNTVWHHQLRQAFGDR